MNATDLVLKFVDAINHADVGAISDLRSDDHLFIDSDGTEIRGRESMREAWNGYFSMMPDYKIQVQEIFSRRQAVVLIGTATGTYSSDGKLDPSDRWKVPAAWRAVVRGDRIAVWQVFVNPEPILRIMRRYHKGTA
jgi:ketosteroid isomerase-like protein